MAAVNAYGGHGGDARSRSRSDLQSVDTEARVELDCRHAPIMSHLAGIDRLGAASLVAAIPAVSEQLGLGVRPYTNTPLPPLTRRTNPTGHTKNNNSRDEAENRRGSNERLHLLRDLLHFHLSSDFSLDTPRLLFDLFLPLFDLFLPLFDLSSLIPAPPDPRQLIPKLNPPFTYPGFPLYDLSDDHLQGPSYTFIISVCKHPKHAILSYWVACL
ncbi:hypothetical protein FPQ18DRAFT_413921 [Pyronema domesticum]|nr:hypothetical protein FPQ18DRAFT_413921 [Pyronema domesticum]